MSSTTKRLNVAELDFEDIKNNLKTFLRGQDEFRDYDFEGSAMGTLIDILAYTTHYNAVNANLGINETFLDTAQFRGSVVGHARTLGYTPRSATAPAAFVDIVVNNPDSQSLILPRGFRLKAKIGNTTYTFVTDEEYSTTNAAFSDVKIVEGKFKSVEYLYDARGDEKILIPDADVDTDTIRVNVFDSPTSSTSTSYTEAKEITSITSTSEVYFISENPDGLFEVSFGDGVLGKALENGNLVEVEYLTTNKSEANGARIFTTSETIEGNANLTITTTQSARGGEDKENLDSIRHNAPLTFASQNRAVTPQDYEAIVLENFGNVDSIKVWGGEDNDPPVYGKVFLSIKPQTSDILSRQEKTQILEDIITPKAVVTITPEIIDAEFTFISLEVFFKYDSTRTSLSRKQLETQVVDSILNYNQSDLDQFGRVFRHSVLLSTIDDTSDAILNSTARVYVKKRFVPSLEVPGQYTLNFSGALFQSGGQESVITSSSTFTVNDQVCRFIDIPDPDNVNRRIVQIVTGEGTNEIIVIKNAGFIQGSVIVLENFAPTNFQGAFIEIEALPNSNDIAPVLNNILTIDSDELTVLGEVDTIVAGQDFSGVNYNTTPRRSAPTRVNNTSTDTTTSSISTSGTVSTGTSSGSTGTSTPPPSGGGSYGY